MILGVDPGERRVGVAAADLETRIAVPVETIDARRLDPVARIAEIARERAAVRVVVGKPVGLSGDEGAAVEKQRELVALLRAALDIEVSEFDERLSTVVAERAMRAAGASAATRREGRDAIAAQVMLQGFMDAAR